MITDEQKLRLDRLSILFLEAFEKHFTTVPHTVEYTDRLEVIIAAKDVRVGNIHVWLDSDEVTIGIGEFFHTHFETYLQDNLSGEAANVAAVNQAIVFIADILADRVVIEVRYKDHTPSMAGIRYLDDTEARSTVSPTQRRQEGQHGKSPSIVTTKQFLWSGELPQN